MIKHGQLPYLYSPNLIYHTALGFALQEQRGPQRRAYDADLYTHVLKRGGAGVLSPLGAALGAQHGDDRD